MGLPARPAAGTQCLTRIRQIDQTAAAGQQPATLGLGDDVAIVRVIAVLPPDGEAACVAQQRIDARYFLPAHSWHSADRDARGEGRPLDLG